MLTDLRSEVVLVTASRTVLTAFRESLEAGELPVGATAALRLLQTALEPYGTRPAQRLREGASQRG